MISFPNLIHKIQFNANWQEVIKISHQPSDWIELFAVTFGMFDVFPILALNLPTSIWCHSEYFRMSLFESECWIYEFCIAEGMMLERCTNPWPTQAWHVPKVSAAILYGIIRIDINGNKRHSDEQETWSTSPSTHADIFYDLTNVVAHVNTCSCILVQHNDDMRCYNKHCGHL